MPSTTEIHLAGEGDLDIAVGGRLIVSAGATIGLVQPAYSKTRLDPKLPKYKQAATHMPWLILRDLDWDAPCPGALVSEKVGKPSQFLCFIIPVRAIESWLMADRQAFAEALRVAVKRVPENPEHEIDPKRKIVDLARQSRSRAIQRALVARERTGGVIGPEYSAWMMRFAQETWSPRRAADASPSLTKAMVRVQELIRRAREANL
jgi:hypothetical protein